MKMEYSRENPTNQSIVDIFRGSWFSAFPDDCGVEAGQNPSFDMTVDTRVPWGNETLSRGVRSANILELGPFEAFHTWQFEQLGATSVTAIEANNINFLKCLIVKEVTGLKARFLFGDFIPYLEFCSESFDIVWASGVLYHQIEPLKLLGLISKVTDRVFIHTHYYVDDVIREHYPYDNDFRSKYDKMGYYGGFKAKLHYHSYDREKSATVFAGGSLEYSYWMEKEDIFNCLKHFGFSSIKIGVDHPHNPMGPAMYFIAERPN